MTPEQIKAAKERAAEVVNGFKRSSEQNARDALKLAEECETKNRQISALKRRMLADALLNASKTGKPKSSFGKAFDDLFREIGV